MDVEAKRFSTGGLVQLSGYEPQTFHKHRQRHGLFRESEDRGARGLFSLIDVCVARLVVVLIRHGLSASDATDFASGEGRYRIGRLLRGNSDDRLVVFKRSRGDGPLQYMTLEIEGLLLKDCLKAADEARMVSVVDINGIVRDVLDRVQQFRPAAMATAEEIDAALLGPLAQRLGSHEEDRG